MKPAIPAAPQRRRRTTRCRLAGLLTVSVLLGTTACAPGGDSATGPGNDHPAGTYSLRSVDGKNIPAEVDRAHDPGTDASADAVTHITGGEITLSEDGTVQVTVDYVLVFRGQEIPATTGAEGTYEVTGNTISFDDVTGSAPFYIGRNMTGAVRNGVITVDLPTFGKAPSRTFVYRYVP